MNNKNNELGAERDPVGSLFLKDGKILRGIRWEFQEYYISILSNPVVQGMLGNEIIDTVVTGKKMEDYSLILEHLRIKVPSYCYEWPMQMLRDAAIRTLDICIKLNETGNVLKDATPWNILYDGANPVLVDFTSIAPQERDLLWVAYDQFCRMFLFPLLIGNTISGKMTRALLEYSTTGVTYEEVGRFLPFSCRFNFPWLVNRLDTPKMMVDILRKTGQDKDLSRLKQNVSYTLESRKAFFETLRRDVLSIKFETGKSRWSAYYDDINTFFTPDVFNKKQQIIAELLARYQPKTVTDIGCNQGGYAILAAQAGAKVIAFDTDEDSITLLYRLTQLKNLSILPLIGDVTNPAPRTGWRALEFPAAPVRFCSEMAFALALVHHLAITQMQSFNRIVCEFSDYTDRWLVTEFVPIEDPRSQELLLTNRRDISWFTVDRFVEALQGEFKRVESFPSHPDGRTLFLCEK